MLQRRPARQGRDPPDAGRHALLADDLQQADLRRIVQVRAAAKLLAEIPDGNHPHHVGILFAEEHHRPRLPGLGQRHRRRADRLALENFFIDLRLDPGQLLGADGRRIGEVEPQQVVVHFRALLQGVLAQVRAEGVVEQMGGRMGPADARPAPRIDPRGNRRAQFQAAFAEVAAVQDQRAVDLGIDDLEAEAVADDLAGVAHLSAHLAVERRLVEDDDDRLVGVVLGDQVARAVVGDDEDQPWRRRRGAFHGRRTAFHG